MNAAATSTPSITSLQTARRSYAVAAIVALVALVGSWLATGSFAGLFGAPVAVLMAVFALTTHRRIVTAAPAE